VKYLVALLIPAVVSATDMTTQVEVSQYKHGAWRFTNTTNKHLRCNMGLTEYPRWSTSIMPKSPSLEEPFKVPGTTGNRNFDLEPYDTYVYNRKNVGTIYCELGTDTHK
jgi:hypothetical protein